MRDRERGVEREEGSHKEGRREAEHEKSGEKRARVILWDGLCYEACIQMSVGCGTMN